MGTLHQVQRYFIIYAFYRTGYNRRCSRDKSNYASELKYVLTSLEMNKTISEVKIHLLWQFTTVNSIKEINNILRHSSIKRM